MPRAVARELPAIARAVDKIVRAFRNGGRLIYVGAGSSGRMGALDAPNVRRLLAFRQTQVQAILAGGFRAMTHAIEGAEDSPRDGARQIAAHRVGPNDVVVGIAATGTTPFVLGALRESKRRGATTVALTANRRAPIARSGTYRHRSGHRRPKYDRGLDAHESGYSAEIGPQHALYRGDGSRLGYVLR